VDTPSVKLPLCKRSVTHHFILKQNCMLLNSRSLALPSEETLKQWLKEEQYRLEKQFDFGSTKKPNY
jgi:hypothetical protein